MPVADETSGCSFAITERRPRGRDVVRLNENTRMSVPGAEQRGFSYTGGGEQEIVFECRFSGQSVSAHGEVRRLCGPWSTFTGPPSGHSRLAAKPA